MSRHVLKLANDKVRALAHRWVDAAPDDMIVTFQDKTRTIEQNSKLWAMLGDVSKQKEHNGKLHSPEVWKELFMHSLGHECRFQTGLDGEVFPTGFKSSQLGTKKMSDLIEWIYKYGAENGIVWKETKKYGFMEND